MEVPQNAFEADYREAFFPKAKNVVGDERYVAHMIQVNVCKNNPFHSGLFGRREGGRRTSRIEEEPVIDEE